MALVAPTVAPLANAQTNGGLGAAPIPNNCTATDPVVASCWGFDATDSTAFLQAAIDSGASHVFVPRMASPWVLSSQPPRGASLATGEPDRLQAVSVPLPHTNGVIRLSRLGHLPALQPGNHARRWGRDHRAPRLLSALPRQPVPRGHNIQPHNQRRDRSA